MAYCCHNLLEIAQHTTYTMKDNIRWLVSKMSFFPLYDKLTDTTGTDDHYCNTIILYNLLCCYHLSLN